MATKKIQATKVSEEVQNEDVLTLVLSSNNNFIDEKMEFGESEELQHEDLEEYKIEDAEIIEMQRAHKSAIVSEIKKRACNLDRFKNGRATKFDGDKYIYRKLLQMVDASKLEELNELLKIKLSKLI